MLNIRSRVCLAWLRITMVLLDTLLLDRLCVLLLIPLQLENSSVSNKISSTQEYKTTFSVHSSLELSRNFFIRARLLPDDTTCWNTAYNGSLNYGLQYETNYCTEVTVMQYNNTGCWRKMPIYTGDRNTLVRILLKWYIRIFWYLLQSYKLLLVYIS